MAIKYKKYILILLVSIVALVIAVRIGYSKAERMYRVQIDYLNIELDKCQNEKQELIASIAAKPIYSIEAEAMARVLYGVKNNNDTDLTTLCWCILNRVDNPQFPNSILQVVEQESQWMGYSASNPVIDDFYNIACEAIDYWMSGRRPCDNSFVFMDWDSNRIVLRNTFKENKTTKYWSWLT